MRRCIVFAIALCLFGCGKENLEPVDHTVHLAGTVLNADLSNVASYWRDSVYTSLAIDATASAVSSLCVDGSSVLIAGTKFFLHSALQSVIWRDGAPDVLDEVFGEPLITSRDNNLVGLWIASPPGPGWAIYKNGTSQPLVDTAYHFGPFAMALLGDDVYVAGCSSGRGTAPYYNPPQRAQCWKNGELIFRESEVSNALAIFIHQNDVYMAGHLYIPWERSGAACYWKNGKRVNLTDINAVAMARSIFVTDAHVYVAGVMNDQAVYWKDGELIALTTTGTNSIAHSIFVQGTDVHVAGSQNGHPAYWKNNVRQNIANQDKRGEIRFVVVGSN